MVHDSRYRQMLAPPARVNRGFDFAAGGLLPRFVSARLYANPMIAGFLTRLDRAFVELAESVKYLQFFYNYAIDKNDRSLNL